MFILKYPYIYKYIIYLFSIFIILSCLSNVSHSLLNYFTSNISIRNSFFSKNIISTKGTHAGGEKYLALNRKYKMMFLNHNQSLIEL